MNPSKFSNWSDCAPVVLRYGLVFVFVWFGISQLVDQARWVSLIPEFVTEMTGLSASTFVIINGSFEILAAILLAFGIQIRIVAGLLALHMFTIVIDLGLTAVGVRDIGLVFACLSVALHGADKYSFDKAPV